MAPINRPEYRYLVPGRIANAQTRDLEGVAVRERRIEDPSRGSAATDSRDQGPSRIGCDQNRSIRERELMRLVPRDIKLGHADADETLTSGDRQSADEIRRELVGLVQHVAVLLEYRAGIQEW